jgi:hypothetical protein
MDMKHNTRVELVHEIIWCMFRVQCGKLRINHLTSFLVVTMVYAWWFVWWVDYIEDSSSDAYILNLGLRFEGLF